MNKYELKKHKHMISQPYMETRLEVYKKSHEVYFDKDKTYMRSVDVMITTRCSLKCVSCSNLMQYYVDPKNSEFDNTLQALEILNQNVDHISEFRVIASNEPFSISKPSSVANRIALSILSGSSEYVVFGFNGVRIIPFFKSLKPLKGSNRFP